MGSMLKDASIKLVCKNGEHIHVVASNELVKLFLDGTDYCIDDVIESVNRSNNNKISKINKNIIEWFGEYHTEILKDTKHNRLIYTGICIENVWVAVRELKNSKLTFDLFLNTDSKQECFARYFLDEDRDTSKLKNVSDFPEFCEEFAKFVERYSKMNYIEIDSFIDFDEFMEENISTDEYNYTDLYYFLFEEEMEILEKKLIVYQYVLMCYTQYWYIHDYDSWEGTTPLEEMLSITLSLVCKSEDEKELSNIMKEYKKSWMIWAFSEMLRKLIYKKFNE